MLGSPPGWTDGLEFSSDDTVTLTAARAWEADEIDVIHFSGDFVMQAPDWSLSGDTAVVYGDLDDPERILVKGSPARISFLREADSTQSTEDENERVDGSAAVVEYFRATDKVTMRGNATLARKDSTLASELIEYDVEADRRSAGGEGGVEIIFNRDED